MFLSSLPFQDYIYRKIGCRLLDETTTSRVDIWRLWKFSLFLNQISPTPFQIPSHDGSKTKKWNVHFPVLRKLTHICSFYIYMWKCCATLYTLCVIQRWFGQQCWLLEFFGAWMPLCSNCWVNQCIFEHIFLQQLYFLPNIMSDHQSSWRNAKSWDKYLDEKREKAKNPVKVLFECSDFQDGRNHHSAYHGNAKVTFSSHNYFMMSTRFIMHHQ